MGRPVTIKSEGSMAATPVESVMCIGWKQGTHEKGEEGSLWVQAADSPGRIAESQE